MRGTLSSRLITIPILALLAVPALGWQDDVQIRRAMPRGTLGVRLERSETVGLRVKEVRSGGAAEAAGIGEGDLLLTIEGTELTRPHDVVMALAGRSAGEEVSVSVWSDGEARSVTVKLAEGGNEGGDRAIGQGESRRLTPKDRDEPDVGPRGGWLGIAVTPGSEEVKGVRVGRVFPAGPAARAGVRRGMVLLAINGQSIREHEDLKSALEQMQPGDDVTLKVTHGANPDLYEEELTFQLGDSRRVRRRSISADDPLRASPDYWEDSQGFATQISPRDLESEQQRRLAEQNERLERLLIDLREEVAGLREEVSLMRSSQ